MMHPSNSNNKFKPDETQSTSDADSSLIRAEEIVVTLNPESFDIASVNASRIESLRGTTRNRQRSLKNGIELVFSEEQPS
jgi:tRNA A37 threonylcarbamoyladenosine dehydratase